MATKTKGDDGFGVASETQESSDCAAYYTYKGIRRDCKYTHKQALAHIGYNEGEFAAIKAQYEPTEDMIS